MDPNRQRIQVIYNGAKPDLLRNEAQAIMTGQMGDQMAYSTPMNCC